MAKKDVTERSSAPAPRGAAANPLAELHREVDLVIRTLYRPSIIPETVMPARPRDESFKEIRRTAPWFLHDIDSCRER